MSNVIPSQDVFKPIPKFQKDQEIVARTLLTVIHENSRVVTLSMGELDTTSKGDSGLGLSCHGYIRHVLSLSNDDGNAENEAGKKMDLYLTFEFDKYLDLFNTPSGLKPYSSFRCKRPAINSR